MSRDRIVSVRLDETEYEALKRLGGPTEIVRRALREVISPRSAPVVQVPLSTSGISPGYCVHWSDGSVGATWPAPNG